ncbi:N-acetylmuramoyl-L-alanine amidase CwlD [Alkalicoccobacillus porphyridii]|uniref:N-acetylmuramoyl-L-alanine amidase CwlD n=1 Tax=Alkalicoccobacillus porphyridii TaxID=2597270 RepID=A0A553ZTM6_9BACI|nr:N-acetylmuramoyl-L-alanine amidase CwlD [Alkalicoccobacillus porphyridii]TSB44827.1 N-acetylmuramoyl-L-alanine amidase CwlD [Alkalicoccobacillus porphyridii]
MRLKWMKVIIGSLCAAALFYIIQDQLQSDKSIGWHLPLSQRVIVIDAGHGGMDGGATSNTGYLEKDATLEIAKKVRDYLQEAGAIVLLTRETDADLANEDTKRIRTRKTEDLKRRAELVNESDADMFISIHLNAIPSPRWRGAQTFYHLNDPQNQVVAKLIQDELVRNLANTNRVAKPIQHVYLLKEAKIPGALIEAGFLSNPDEAQLLETDEYQESVAASIYQGILRYYSGEEAPN